MRFMRIVLQFITRLVRGAVTPHVPMPPTPMAGLVSMRRLRQWLGLDRQEDTGAVFEVRSVPAATDLVEMMCSPSETAEYNKKHASRGATNK